MRWLGRVPYSEALELQRGFHRGSDSHLLLVEHDHTFTYGPNAGVSSVSLAASFLGWEAGAIPLTARPDGVYDLTLDLSELAPGSYGYKVIVDGEWLFDPSNKMRRFDDGVLA